MNKEIAKSVWQHLTDNGKTHSNFQTWAHNVSSDEKVQGSVHDYLVENKLTSSDKATWLNNIGLGKTEDIAQPGAPAVSVDTESAPVDGSSGSPVVANEDAVSIAPNPEPKVELTAKHPPLELFTEADESTKGYWFKESEIAEKLNEYYGENNLGKNIRFEEAKRGSDALELLIGDQKSGDGEIFRFEGGFGEGFAKQLSVLNPWGDRDYTKQSFSNEEQFEAIQLHIEKTLNPDIKTQAFDAVLDVLKREDLAVLIDDNEDNQFELLKKLDEHFNATGDGTGGDRKLDNTTEMSVIPLAEEKIDVKGSIDLGNGLKVPYKYILDNAQDFKVESERRANLEMQKEQKIDEAEILIDAENLTEGVEYTGVFDDVNKEVRHQVIFGNRLSQDFEINRVTKRIKYILENPDQTRVESPIGAYEGELDDLKNELSERLKTKDIDYIWDPNDPAAGLLDIQRIQEEERIVNLSEEDNQVEVNALLLSKDHSLYDLNRSLVETRNELVMRAQTIGAQEDGVRSSRAMFALERIGGGFEGDIDRIVQIGEQGNLDGAGIPSLSSHNQTQAVRDWNETRERLITLQRAIALNDDPSKQGEENLIGEIINDLSESFTGFRVLEEATGDIISRDKEAEVFNYALQEAGFIIPNVDDHGSRIPVKDPSFWSTHISDATGRSITEGSAQVITDMAPLLVELFVFKKLGGMKAIGAGSTARSGMKLSRLNKAGLSAGRSVQRFAARFGIGSPSRKLPKIYKSLLNNVIVPGVATTMEWAAAESIGEATMGWKAQTIDWETGETRFTFPFVMGMTGALFGRFQQNLLSNLKKNKHVGGVITAFTNTNMETLAGRSIGKTIKPYTNFIGSSVGKGATGTALLTGAELGQMQIDSLMKEGRFADAEEMASLFDTEHLINTFVAMTVLGGKDLLPEAREAVRRSTLAKKFRTKESDAASETLGKVEQTKDGVFKDNDISKREGEAGKEIDKKAKEEKEEINKETDKKVKEIKDGPDTGKGSRRRKNKKVNQEIKKAKEKKNKIDAEAEKQKEPLKNAAKELRLHNDLLSAQRAAKAQGEWTEYLVEQSKNLEVIKGDTRLLSDEQLDRFAELSTSDIHQMLYMQGIKPGSGTYNYFTGMHELTQHATKMADSAIVNGKEVNVFSKDSAESRKKRRDFIENQVEIFKNTFETQALEKAIKEDKDDIATKTRNEEKLRDLKERKKELIEKSDLDRKSHKEYIEKTLDIEIEWAKAVAEKYGIKGENFEVLSAEEWKKKGYEESAEGFHVDIESGKIAINRDAAVQMSSLGLPVHEVIHHFLKNSLKSTDKFGNKYVDKRGSKIIDQFLDIIGKKDRKTLDAEMITRGYRYKEMSKEAYDNLSEADKFQIKKVEKGVGALKDQYKVEFKEEYYKEEAITVYGQGLKEGLFKYERSTGKKVQDFFYPAIKKVLPNVYSKTNGGTRSIEAGKDLYELLADVYETSEAHKVGEKINRPMKELMVTGEKVDGKNVSASRKRIKKGVKVETRLEQGVNSLAEGKKTQAEWLERKTQNAAADAIKSGGVINNYIKGKGLSPGEFKETIESVRDRLKNFDPEAKRKTGSQEPITLLEFVNSNIKFGRLDAKKALYKKSVDIFETAKDIDAKTSEGVDRYQPKAETESRVVDFEAQDMSMGARGKRKTRVEQGKPEVEGPKSKLKELVLKNNSLADPSANNVQLVNKFRAAVQSALKSAGYTGATAKGKPFLFRDNIEKSFENDMFKSVKNSFGKNQVYKDFIKSDATFDVVKDMPTRQFTKAKMDFAYEAVINPKTGKQGRMNAEEMIEAGYPESYDKGVAPPKWKRKNFTKQDFIDWAQAKGKSGSTQGTRKDALARMIAIETAKDAVPVALSKPFMPAYDVNGKPRTFAGEPVTVDVIKELTTHQKVEVAESALKAKVLDVINRDPSIQFSLKKKVAAFEKEMEGKGIMEQARELSKPEHRDIKKHYDKESNRLFGMDYESKALELESKIWDESIMHELKYAEAEVILSGEQLKELNELADNAVTEANFKEILKKFNKENKTGIPADSQKFAFGTEGKLARENFFKRQGDIYDLLPAEFLNNPKLVTALFKTGGLGSLVTRERTDHFEKEVKKYAESISELTRAEVAALGRVPVRSFEDGGKLKYERESRDYLGRQRVTKLKAWHSRGLTLLETWRNGSPEVKKQIEKQAGVKFKYGVKQKNADRGKGGDVKFMIENFGRVIKGANVEGEKIKNSKGKLVPLSDAMHIANISNFKASDSKAISSVTQFEKANKKLREENITLYNQKLAEWAKDRLSAKGFTYEQTERANKHVRETLVKALVEYAYAPKLTAKEFAARAEMVHKFLQIQTNIGEGLIKGLNTIRYITNQPPTPSKYSPTGYHAEHAFFNLAHTASFSHLLSKHKKSGSVEDFMKEYEGVSSNMEQFVIQETTRQGNEGKQADGSVLGNTEFFKGGNVFSSLNVMSSNPRVAFELVDLRTGKTIGETMSKNLKLGEAEGVVLARALGKNLNLVEQGKKKFDKVDSKNAGQLPSSAYSKKSKKSMTFEEKTNAIKMVNKALANGRRTDNKKKGMSTFDFDETLIVKGENFVTATKGKETIKISSENFPLEGPRLEAEGYKFDFKDFVNVKGGVEGPLFKKLQKQIAKYGNENVFVLTARMAESAPAIHAWLKSKGVKLPIENITGLGQSAGEAKGRWMLEKFSEGYNDMYFVDDAMPNVKAVKKVLDQLDIKSDVQQVRFSKKKKLNVDVNDIMKHSLGIESGKRFSKAEGRMRGKGAKRRKLFVPDTAADLGLLLEPLYGKGKEGIKNKEWFEENFYKKFERGINTFNTAKQTLSREYTALRKGNKDIVKSLGKEVPGTNFTHDQAMRVYLWNKSGFKVPDLAETTQKKLVEYIESNPRHKAYAESFSEMKGGVDGVKKPTAEWWAESIASEINNADRGVGRKDHLNDFIEARETIFSEVNLNKMESKLGKNWRDTIEDMFERMETGRSKSERLSEGTNTLLNYFNGSVGTIMSFNTRSGLLQLISSVNFINSSFNNPVRAAQALANVPQYSKDFMRILNSDMLKQRRDGLEINVTESEIASAAKNSKNPGQAIIAKILKAGYLPTKMADSFAIASGGATYYRNAIRMYTKKGMSKVEAEKQAFLDFQAIAERTQQSSRPDLISKQQTTFVGKSILNFANTPMQMNRLALKEMLDIGKGRYKNKAEFMDKLGKVGYYGFVQTMIFAGLQTAAFAVLGNSDDEELKAEKVTKMMETVMDSSLRGMGIAGAVLNGVVNAGKEFFVQRDKDYGADYSEVAEDLLSISPIVGSKFRKMDSAGNTYKYNKKRVEEEGIELSLDSPGLEIATQVTEALVNIPVHRLFKKLTNLRNAADADYAAWERFLMALGWTSWDVNPELSKEKSKDAKNKSKEKPAEEKEEFKPMFKI